MRLETDRTIIRNKRVFSSLQCSVIMSDNWKLFLMESFRIVHNCINLKAGKIAIPLNSWERFAEQ